MKYDDVAPGPWKVEHSVNVIAGDGEPVVYGDWDGLSGIRNEATAQFIAEARERVPYLEYRVKVLRGLANYCREFWEETHNRVEKALDMHREHDCAEDPCWFSSADGCDVSGRCQECREEHPCSTRTTLTGEDE